MTPDLADTSEARDRRVKMDNLIVIAVTVILFVVLEIIVPEIVRARMTELDMRPDGRTLRWVAEKKLARSS